VCFDYTDILNHRHTEAHLFMVYLSGVLDTFFAIYSLSSTYLYCQCKVYSDLLPASTKIPSIYFSVGTCNSIVTSWIQARYCSAFDTTGQMHRQATIDRLGGRTIPNVGNTLPNTHSQIRLSVGFPRRNLDGSQLCVGGAGVRNTTATEPQYLPPPGSQTALNRSNQISLGENRLAPPLGLQAQPGPYAAAGWPPFVPTLGAPNALPQFTWQASQYSFGHPQTGLSQQTIHSTFTPQDLAHLIPRFTLHPSVQQELLYPLHLDPRIVQAHQLRRAKILPWNWTPACPLPEGLGMTMLWNDLVSAYIPHIYPQQKPWKNISGRAIDPNLWGAQLNMSEDPPWWFSEGIDLGPPVMEYPPEIDLPQYKYDKAVRRRRMVGIKPFYRFDPWADVRLYERNEYGRLARLELYNEWLQICTNAYGEEASPVAVSLLHAKRYYQQPPGTKRIFDDECGEGRPGASADGSADTLPDPSTGASIPQESPQRNTANLDDSVRKPTTPARLLGVNPWMGQREYPDATGYTGVLRQSVPPIPSRLPPGLPFVLHHDIPKPIANYPMPPPPIVYPPRAIMPPPGLESFAPLPPFRMPLPGAQYHVHQSSFPMPPPTGGARYRQPADAYRETLAIGNPAPTIQYNLQRGPGPEHSAQPPPENILIPIPPPQSYKY